MSFENLIDKVIDRIQNELDGSFEAVSYTHLQMILMELWPLQWKVLLMDVGMLC